MKFWTCIITRNSLYILPNDSQLSLVALLNRRRLGVLEFAGMFNSASFVAKLSRAAFSRAGVSTGGARSASLKTGGAGRKPDTQPGSELYTIPYTDASVCDAREKLMSVFSNTASNSFDG